MSPLYKLGAQGEKVQQLDKFVDNFELTEVRKKLKMKSIR
jgi:hypothetical protein